MVAFEPSGPTQSPGDMAVVPRDFTLSPLTGLTREHWVTHGLDLVREARRFASPAGARINLPGPPSAQGMRSDGLEGFARTFLLCSFLKAGGENRSDGFLSNYVDGIVAGTRTPGADDDESWPIIGRIGRDGQPMVEAASIALSLHLTRADSWERLDAAEQDRVEGWLREALRHEPSSNNWYLFPLTVASFLEAVGRGDRETDWAIERGLSLLDQWYRGEGWYSDGDGEAFDHYVGWALHFYPVLHAILRADNELLLRLGTRLDEFLRTFILTFDRTGAPLYFGRSLTYRTATTASVGIGAATGFTPLRPGQSRALMSRTLQYFADRGSRSDGLFTRGWHGEHAATLQPYTSPAGPYWAAKGLYPIVLPASHPFWSEREEEPEPDQSDRAAVVKSAGLLIQRTAADGLVRVHNHGSDHIKPHEADAGGPDPLYARLAYSTRTGPTALHNPEDNHVTVQFEGVWSVRRRIHRLGSGTNWVASWHAPRFSTTAPLEASPYSDAGPVLPSARIESLVAVDGATEVHVHRLINIPPDSQIRVSGWAVACSKPEECTSTTDGLSSTVTCRTGGELVSTRLVGLHGWASSRTRVAPAGTAFGPWAVVPVLAGSVAAGRVFVSASSLDSSLEESPLPTVSLDGSEIRIAWPSGERTTIDLEQAFAREALR